MEMSTWRRARGVADGGRIPSLAALALAVLLTACGDSNSLGPVGGNRILRVDAAAAAGGDGSSWALAFSNLDSALNAAGRAGNVGQIWVAAGTYRPAGVEGFLMVSGVDLYGGFAGESSPTGRDLTANETILDGAGAHHVLRAELTDGGSIDGFTITGGNASGDGAEHGGGAFFQIAARDEPPTVRNCRFVGNRAEGFGGGLYVNRGTEVVHCLFLDNEAQTGGGLFMHGINDDHAVIAGCRFLGNGRSGGLSGGGGLEVWSERSATILFNVFSGNVADFAALSVVGSAEIINCTLSNNTTRLGNGIAGLRASSGRIVVANSILWNNRSADGRPERAQLRTDQGGSLLVRNSCIDSLRLHEGNGNSGYDPLFIDADGADDVAGTLDDELRLSGSSPSRNAGNVALLGRDVGDLDDDGDSFEDVPVDLAGTALSLTRVSQGAYE